MKQPKIKIYVNISSKYLDIADIFFELFYKFWNDCPYPITVFCDKKIDRNYRNVTLKICDEKESLPGRIYSESLENQADLYICLLGDALICNQIMQKDIENLMEYLIHNDINYCNIIPKKSRINKTGYRLLDSSTIYGISFIAFIASHKFIMEEFRDNVSDYDFEVKYLQMTNKKVKEVWHDKVILNKNYFNIIHGIQKGKWINKSYRILRKVSYKLTLSQREKLSVKEELFNMAVKIFRYPVLKKIRKPLKGILSKVGIGFVTGV